ncbi:MAG: (deoxy)nucleoside triphosphate pyrophosphohydrolase [Archangiaceae bacterium]|nr:(deoxy)nucleoside triphosphate pyrophosphohydrolase [Archangiaceae bacterium]
MPVRKQLRVVGAMLEREPGRYLITQRRASAVLPLLWEFPGGRVRDGEEPEVALVRSIKERLGIDVVVDAKASTMKHDYPDYEVDFSVFHCRLTDPLQEVSHAKVNSHTWATLGEMSELEFPDADARTLGFLLESEG